MCVAPQAYNPEVQLRTARVRVLPPDSAKDLGWEKNRQIYPAAPNTTSGYFVSWDAFALRALEIPPHGTVLTCWGSASYAIHVYIWGGKKMGTQAKPKKLAVTSVRFV